MTLSNTRIDLKDVVFGISKYQQRADAAILMYAKTKATQLQNYAKKNRPWTDRTAQARIGLFGEAERTDDKVTIYICHTVDYGIYLELAHGKQYAILWPTIEDNANDIMDGAKMLFDKIRI